MSSEALPGVVLSEGNPSAGSGCLMSIILVAMALVIVTAGVVIAMNWTPWFTG